MATELWLKKQSGEFDLESVYMLDLSNQGLTSVGSLPLCTQLCVLNLSNNQLTSVKALSTLTCLEWLDLSSNQITSLEGLDPLEKLNTLNLAGNLIDSLDCLLSLTALSNLRKLTLSHHKPSTRRDTPLCTNPVCRHPSYKNFQASPHDYIPSLHWLDGELVGGVFHARVREVCEGSGICDEVESETRDATQTIDNLQNPLEGFNLECDHTTSKKLSALISDCSEVTRKVDHVLNELGQQLTNTDSL